MPGLDFTVALVALPWARIDRPSTALGALAAYVHRERPAFAVECHHEFLAVAEALPPAVYDAIADAAPYEMGELCSLHLLYGQDREGLAAHFAEWIRPRLPEGGGALFDDVIDRLRAHADGLAERLAGRDVVALTVTFGQLFASLDLAARIKTRSPGTRIVLGGSLVSGRAGVSVLREYEAVDFIVQGEGEQPFVALLDALSRGEPSAADGLRGVLSRGNLAERPRGAPLWEVADLDSLPLPDYDSYCAAAAAQGVRWYLPVEGSRGCWWDRTHRTGNAKDTCRFCNINTMWGGYRHKSPARVAAEVGALSDRYDNPDIFFVDSILPRSQVGELADAIAGLGRDLDVFYEMRAHILPVELLRLHEAGLSSVQFGIEGLSTSYLRRIGKGTSLLQNLQVMKLCSELGIAHGANLLTDFPGATADEVEETARHIRDYACAYEPLSRAVFHLGIDSTAELLPDDFAIERVRNKDEYLRAMPRPLWERLKLFDLDYDTVGPATDWTPAAEAMRAWLELHERRRGAREPVVFYRDCGSFLQVVDHRFGERLEGSFRGLDREVLLHCAEIRSFEEMVDELAHGDKAALRDSLARLEAAKLVAGERDRYLTIPCARTPGAAARRIRQAESGRAVSKKRPSRRLSVVG